MSPEPAFIEIVEAHRAPTVADTGGYIKPDEVRINGIPLAVPLGESVRVHAIQLNSDDVVTVTLTLYARRVVIGHKDEL